MERISLAQVNNGERFFRVPKLLFESEIYKKMSADSKLLYAILKDRFELSVKNNWIDPDGNIYFIFTVEEIGEMLGCGKDKVIKLKKELKKYDLLEEVRQGLNKPNLIYLGSLQVENVSKPLAQAEVGKSEFQKSENQNSRNLKNRIQEVGIPESNDTNSSDPDFSDSLISSRKAEKISREISQPTGAGNQQSQNKSDSYIKPEYYSLLQVIADRYNDRLFGFPNIVTITHKQKMQVGKYLEEGYMTSQEVIDIISRIPEDCQSPLAYLLQSLENLKEERRLEAKILAHKRAQSYYES
ncbi:TPA: replication initiator protein A [Streptococcus suis]